jgi:uncharacterized membrane protein YphA (DoxX/SURF4 family)
MTTLTKAYDRLDASLAEWMASHGILLLRLSLGIVFFWFGFLKFFPGLSPAQTLAGDTIAALSFGLLTPQAAVFLLAVWECLIGLGLISGLFLRATLLLLWLQMLGTVTPLFLFPEVCFTSVPFVPTLEGQYILKNAVLVSAGLVIGATVRGGRLVAERRRAEAAA